MTDNSIVTVVSRSTYW